MLPTTNPVCWSLLLVDSLSVATCSCPLGRHFCKTSIISLPAHFAKWLKWSTVRLESRGAREGVRATGGANGTAASAAQSIALRKLLSLGLPRATSGQATVDSENPVTVVLRTAGVPLFPDGCEVLSSVGVVFHQDGASSTNELSGHAAQQARSPATDALAEISHQLLAGDLFRGHGAARVRGHRGHAYRTLMRPALADHGGA
eukprot:scaffold46716_cov72-Phaeocystis_antarctica.AAC.6